VDGGAPICECLTVNFLAQFVDVHGRARWLVDADAGRGG